MSGFLSCERGRFADERMIHASVDASGLVFAFAEDKIGDAFGECFAKVERGKMILGLGFLPMKN